MVGLATKEGRSLELELKAARLLRGVKNEKKKFTPKHSLKLNLDLKIMMSTEASPPSPQDQNPAPVEDIRYLPHSQDQR
jgi:hypothetical protein